MLTSSGGEKGVAKDIENFSQSLYIECAEKAIGVGLSFFKKSNLFKHMSISHFFLKFKEYEIADRCLKLYFSVPAIANQFLARSYLCQFELLAPKSTDQYVDKIFTELNFNLFYYANDFIKFRRIFINLCHFFTKPSNFPNKTNGIYVYFVVLL